MNPTLIIIAGCNGSGKSTFSKAIIDNPYYLNPILIDGDKLYAEEYEKLRDSEFREAFAKAATTRNFNEIKNNSIEENNSFSYETNFNTSPEKIIEEFRNKGFKIHLHYLCLLNVPQAIDRVDQRVEQGGHFVYQDEIEQRFIDGYKNLNNLYKIADTTFVYDSSQNNKDIQEIARFKLGKLISYDKDSRLLNTIRELHELVTDIQKQSTLAKNN